VARFAEEIALAKRFIPGEIKAHGERLQNLSTTPLSRGAC
jgi:hypothetical protein